MTGPAAGTVPGVVGGAMRWGRASNGRRHLVQTLPEYLGRPGVTPVSLCGVELEVVAGPETPWDESPALACAKCASIRDARRSDTGAD
jgi:hypothetical protein